MNKLLLTAFFIGSASLAMAQQDFMLFKKKNKTLAYYRKDSYIVFQLKNRQWYTGFINKIYNDTFDINPMIIHYKITGPDTVHYALQVVALKDVYAMPRMGELVNYANEHASVILGHEHWVWLKNGLIFQAGAGGYILLNVLNGLLKKTKSFSATQLGIAAGVFLFGEILHLTYHSTFKLGKKYYLESLKISN